MITLLCKRITYLLFIFFFIFTISYSKEKREKVTIEQLKETSYPLESNAPAVILNESKEIQYVYNQNEGFTIHTKFYRRIKIYKEDGLRWGTHNIHLFYGNSAQEKASNIKGVTYNLVDGKIETEKLSKKGIFEPENKNDHEKNQKITLPKVIVGSIIEYSYTKISPYYTYIPPIYFERRIPIANIDVNIEIPEFYTYQIQTRGEYPIQINRNTKTSNAQFTSITRSSGNGFTTVRSQSNFEKIDFLSNVYKVKQTNIPSLSDEPFVPFIWNYATTLEFYLKSIRYPNGPEKVYAYSWDDVLKKLTDRSSYKSEVSKSDYYKKDLSLLNLQPGNEKDNVLKIYEFIKKSIRWNKRYTSMAYRGVKKAYKDGVGSSGQINTILISALQHSGIKARPVFVISNKSRKSIFPNINAFDYAITEVTLSNNSKIYLDATQKSGIPNLLPKRVIQGSGKLLSNNKTAVPINLRIIKPSKVQSMLNYTINENGIAVGKLQERRGDYAALQRRNYLKKGNDQNIDFLKKHYNLNEITNYQNNGKDDPYQKVKESFEFEDADRITVVDNEIYVYPMLFLKKNDNPLKQESRKFPVDWEYPIEKSYIINISVPENYTIESIPENTTIGLPNNLGFFKFTTMTIGNSITIRVSEKLSKAFFPINEYKTLQEFYKILVEKQNEQIVLKKK